MPALPLKEVGCSVGYYRFYLLDEGGRILHRESSYFATDGEALEKARELCESHDIEIWRGTTKLGVVNCEKLRALPTEGGGGHSPNTL